MESPADMDALLLDMVMTAVPASAFIADWLHITGAGSLMTLAGELKTIFQVV